MTSNEAQACIDVNLYRLGARKYLINGVGSLNEHARKLTAPNNGVSIARAHGEKIQQLINKGFNIDQSVMNDLNAWLKQMGEVGGNNQERKPDDLPQSTEFDVPEMDGGVELGEGQPQGLQQGKMGKNGKPLREVKYNRPGTPQSIFNPANQPEQSEAGQKQQAEQKPGNQPQPQNQQTPQQQPMQNQPGEKSNLEKMLEAAMKLAEQEAEQRKQEHEEKMANHKEQDSEKVQELDQRVSNLEERVEVIEGNYVGQQTFQDSIDDFQKQLSEISKPKLVQIPERPEVKFDKRTHCAFEEVLFLAQMFQQVYIVGPAGTGKTTLAGDVAKAMALDFGFISCTAGMAEAHLLGRMLADGKYLPTSFVNCYENGGVFLFDEVDAADANTMLVINSALANGILSVPNRAGNPVAYRHKDFVCIVAANTLGTGSFEYHGRNYLDAAFLDRFALSRHRVDYDLDMERDMLAGDPEFCRLLHKMRHNLESTKTRRVLSTRAFVSSAKLLLAGKTPEYVVDKLLLGWTDEEKARAKKDIVVPKASPLKQIGIKNAEREKTKRDQAAAEAKKALKEVAEATQEARVHDAQEVLEVVAEEVAA